MPSYPGYLAGSDGSIIGKRGFFLSQARTPGGYLCFRFSRPGYTPVTVSSHVGICEAFHGIRPPGMEVAHENGIKTDNRADNLSWKTPAQNTQDKIRHGTHVSGIEHYACRLTDDQVRDIRTSADNAVILAKRYAMSPAYVRHVRAGRARKNVTP
jgi:hypothetical protein